MVVMEEVMEAVEEVTVVEEVEVCIFPLPLLIVGFH
jgi:hypothetical protein